MIFIPEHRDRVPGRAQLIEHDVDLILGSLDRRIGAAEIHAIIVIMLANRFIWENESKARAGGSEQDKLLKLTHSINGVRATAKNQLSALVGGRKDYKIDALASDLPTGVRQLEHLQTKVDLLPGRAEDRSQWQSLDEVGLRDRKRRSPRRTI